MLRAALDEIVKELKNRRSYIHEAKPFVFVCGGTLASDDSIRKHFLTWAGARDGSEVFFVAESGYKSLMAAPDPRFQNLAHFESALASLADCVIIFIESPGAFAELGLFSGSEEIARKTLLVNAMAHQALDSFISIGPIATINAASLYQPCLYFNYQDQLEPIFSEILTRMHSRIGDHSCPN
jgi:hypothetical protein